MWDESNDYQEVLCPYCGSGNDCEHLVASVDITFDQWLSGEAIKHYEGWLGRVEEVFRGLVDSGEEPQGVHGEVESAWSAFQEYAPEAARSVGSSLPSEAAVDLFFAAMENAGGNEFPGNAVGEMTAGGESAFRVMHASNPKAVCEKTAVVLEDWLTSKEPKRKRRKQ